MSRHLPLAVLAVALLVASPTLARERCDSNDTTPGLKVEFGFSIGTGLRDAQMDEQLLLMQLKQNGVDARSVRIATDGCLEAFVQGADGSFHNEYYHPRTFRRMN